MNKKAFTLIELIVVITVLAILSTIAFISFIWYSLKSRDAVRISDIDNIVKTLELSKIKLWEYPTPTYPVEISYSWSKAWEQWTFWENMIKITDTFSKVPTDPLTHNEYTYSRVNTKKEYQVATILEWDDNFSYDKDLLLNKTFAWDQLAKAYVKWDYNWKVVKVNNWNITYILAVPSIIWTDKSLLDIIEIINQKKLVYDSFNNLPASYKNTQFNINWWFDFNPWEILVYSWTISDLINNESARINFIKDLQESYSWTIVSNIWWIDYITDVFVDSSNPTDSAKALAIEIINEITDFNIPEIVVLDNSNSSSSSSNWWWVTNKFISTWDTTKIGNSPELNEFTTNDHQIKLPLRYPYNAVVERGDGLINTITTWNQAELIHTYNTPWIYDITITWEISWFSFVMSAPPGFVTNDNIKLIDIKQWWGFSLWNELSFKWCKNLITFSASDIPNLNWIIDMSDMFSSASSFNWDISWWDVRNVINMKNMFSSASSFNWDISWWNVGNVTNMKNMFMSASSFDQNINWWDVNNVINYTNFDLNTSPSWIVSEKPDFSFNFS